MVADAGGLPVSRADRVAVCTEIDALAHNRNDGRVGNRGMAKLRRGTYTIFEQTLCLQ